MIITKKIMIPVAAAIILTGVGLYSWHTQALASSSGQTNQTLAQAIASAFGLDTTKVQGVITGYRQNRQTQRANTYEQRLQRAVTAGTLTSAQEQAILTEHNTLAAEIQAGQGESRANRLAIMQKVRTEAQAWAKTNNINVRWLLGSRPLRGSRGMVQMPASSPTPSASPSA